MAPVARSAGIGFPPGYVPHGLAMFMMFVAPPLSAIVLPNGAYWDMKLE